MECPGTTGTFSGQQSLMEPRYRWDISKAHASVHCDGAGPNGAQENIVTQWNLMEPSVHCFTVQPYGVVETIVLQWNILKSL